MHSQQPPKQFSPATNPSARRPHVPDLQLRPCRAQASPASSIGDCAVCQSASSIGDCAVCQSACACRLQVPPHGQHCFHEPEPCARCCSSPPPVRCRWPTWVSPPQQSSTSPAMMSFACLMTSCSCAREGALRFMGRRQRWVFCSPMPKTLPRLKLKRSINMQSWRTHIGLLHSAWCHHAYALGGIGLPSSALSHASSCQVICT